MRTPNVDLFHAVKLIYLIHFVLVFPFIRIIGMILTSEIEIGVGIPNYFFFGNNGPFFFFEKYAYCFLPQLPTFQRGSYYKIST